MQLQKDQHQHLKLSYQPIEVRAKINGDGVVKRIVEDGIVVEEDEESEGSGRETTDESSADSESSEESSMSNLDSTSYPSLFD